MANRRKPVIMAAVLAASAAASAAAFAAPRGYTGEPAHGSFKGTTSQVVDGRPGPISLVVAAHKRAVRYAMLSGYMFCDRGKNFITEQPWRGAAIDGSDRVSISEQKPGMVHHIQATWTLTFQARFTSATRAAGSYRLTATDWHTSTGKQLAGECSSRRITWTAKHGGGPGVSRLRSA